MEQKPVVFGEKKFCDACIEGSSTASSGSVRTVNGIGRTFYGGAEKCASCGSVVRTLWFVLVQVPIVPLGSYRYLSLGSVYSRDTFLTRKTSWRWNQILLQWAIGLVLGAILFAVIMASVKK